MMPQDFTSTVPATSTTHPPLADEASTLLALEQLTDEVTELRHQSEVLLTRQHELSTRMREVNELLDRLAARPAPMPWRGGGRAPGVPPARLGRRG